ncbi:MAG TPA: hypothetical protein VK607_05970 [Kofleriaceae bacterium]|nr:hypothetical protein [Kofleriaceae bacterium]
MQIALRRLAVVAALSPGTGCHVLVQTETTRALATERIVHAEGAIARRAALVLSDAGRLRFVEPLECPTEEVVRHRATIETAIRPNLATFTVGVIAAAAGGVLLTSGLFASRPAASPYTYLGVAGAGAGLPLAIGPWLGDRVEVRDGGEPPAVRQPGPSQPCGDRPLAARSATLEVSGLEIRGAIDRDGGFAISPYQWIDAYLAASAPASEITAAVDGDGGPRTVSAMLDPRWLAAHAAAFLAHADFDPAVQPLDRVPGIAAGALRVSLATGDDGAAVHVVLALRNAGPGSASAVRGQITAPGLPAIDGRMIYVGVVARGAAIAREVVIPIAARAAAALRGQVVELSVELRDAHDTAPTTPVRFRGALAGDPPR